jgi:hypothetical protein
MQMLAYRFIGTTDEVTACDCCGRQGLKMTIVLAPVDGGDYVFFGNACGAKAQGWGVKDFNAAAKSADIERKNAIKAAKASHPLNAVIESEMRSANTASPRLTYVERRPLMLRWQELQFKIESDVAVLFPDLKK